MKRIDFAGRQTSRIGLGCGRLVGGAGLKASRLVIEAALGLGIRHFDVAPSYGLGLAEDALGDVLAGVEDVTIATKVGIARPGNAKLKAQARNLLRPLVMGSPILKAALGRRGAAVRRNQFAPDDVERSVADSLRRLKRNRVDALLLHEPAAADLTDGLAQTMAGFLHDGRTALLGSSTGAGYDALVPFGTLSQYRFPPDAGEGRASVVLHGALRSFAVSVEQTVGRDAFLRAMDRDPQDPESWPGGLLTSALAARPDTILLLSSTSPARLREAVRGIDWGLAQDGDALAARLARTAPDLTRLLGLSLSASG